MPKDKKLSRRQIEAQRRMDDALFEIICAASAYVAAEKDFYGRHKKQPMQRTTILAGASR